MVKARVVGIAVLVALAVAGAAGAAEPSDELRLFVYSENPNQPLKGIALVLLTRSGARDVGTTDEQGYVAVPRADLTAEGSMALILCYENDSTTCSALRLGDGTVARFHELAVEIPLPRVVDRFTVKAKLP